MANPKVLLMGCGGIGGILAARLCERGAPPLIVAHNPEIADAVNRNGLRLRTEEGERRVAAGASVSIPAGAGAFDFVLLATQPPQAEEAARAAAPHLAPEGAVVCLQNGLCEQRIAAIVGASRTLGAIVAWGASMLAPGVYERTSEGGFVIGRLDGAAGPRLEQLAGVLAAVGPVERTQNLRGARWSKLAINCAISSLGTIGGDRLGALLRYRFARRLALEVMTEVVAVAGARGVRLEKISGTIDLEWVALTAAERLASGSPTLMAKHALLLAVGAKYRRLRSSMLLAIERGREPAVDFLNGEVAWRAAAHGIPAPLNARIVALVHAIARREHQPGIALLRELYRATRDSSVPPWCPSQPTGPSATHVGAGNPPA